MCCGILSVSLHGNYGASELIGRPMPSRMAGSRFAVGDFVNQQHLCSVQCDGRDLTTCLWVGLRDGPAWC